MANTAQLLSVRTSGGELFLVLLIPVPSPTQGKRFLLRWLDKDKKFTSMPKLEQFSEREKQSIESLLRVSIVGESNV